MTDDKKAEEIATKYPGHINFSGQINGHYSGARLMWFANVEEVNAFFEANKHVIVTYLQPDSRGGYSVVYTTQLTQEDLDDLGAWGEKVEAFLTQRKEERAETKRQSEVAAEAERVETKRLADLGKKCEQNHPKIKTKK